MLNLSNKITRLGVNISKIVKFSPKSDKNGVIATDMLQKVYVGMKPFTNSCFGRHLWLI